MRQAMINALIMFAICGVLMMIFQSVIADGAKHPIQYGLTFGAIMGGLIFVTDVVKLRLKARRERHQ